MTITCFAACYVIALAVEVSRLLFRWRVPTIVPLAIGAIGLLAHSLYLIGQAQHELAQRSVLPLSSWYDFCLLAAWVLAGAYLGLMIRRPQNAIGVFLLPLVLSLIGAAAYVYDAAPFPARTANGVWRLVHGLTLMVGTTAVALGFATGLMYILQSYRLKHKLPPPRGFRLPSLEWLQKFNREALFASTCLLAIGLLSGVVLNLISKAGQGNVSWTDPVVLSSGVLFLWLTVVTIFESMYRPAREGNKVAYLTLANFVFLGLALYFVLFGAHATAGTATPPAAQNTSSKVAPFLRPERAARCQPTATPSLFYTSRSRSSDLGQRPSSLPSPAQRAGFLAPLHRGGPTARQFAERCSQMTGPLALTMTKCSGIPARWAGLGKCLGLCPSRRHFCRTTKATPWADLSLPRWGEESGDSSFGGGAA